VLSHFAVLTSFSASVPKRVLAVGCAAVLTTAGLGAASPPADAGAGSPEGAHFSAIAAADSLLLDLVAAADEPAPEAAAGLTTETASTTVLADGTYQTVVNAVPVNYLDASGEWQEIDNDLVPVPGPDWAVRNAANDYTVKLPEDAADAVRMAADGQWLTFSLRGAQGAPVVAGSQATFDEVAVGTDLTYDVTPTGVKESIILAAPPAEAPVYAFDVRVAPGLTPTEVEGGAIEVVDAAGEVAFTVLAPFMVDSATPEPALSSAVDYQLEESLSSSLCKLRFQFSR